MRLITILLIFTCLVQTSCKTIRTTTTKKSSYAINTGDDEEKIREKYKFEFIQDDEGNLVPAKRNKDGKLVADEKKRNLYSDKSTGRGKAFEKKEARLSKRDTAKKQARLPEYLKRQEFRDSKNAAAEANRSSRSADFDSNRSSDAGRVSQSQGKASIFQRLNPFKTDSNASSKTTIDRKADRATAKAPSVTPVPMSNFGESNATGNNSNRTKRSVDEVKRLLSPSRT